MAVTQTLMASGSWELQLVPETPQRVIDAIDFFGHVAITEAPEDIRTVGDNVLSEALYVGVIQGRAADTNGTQIAGAGMAIWLGDADGKGAVYETAKTYTGQTFTSVVTDLLTGTSVHVGTLSSVTGTYTGSHIYQTPRQAIDYVTSTMGAEWRVNGDGTLDAGLVTSLYRTTPRAGIFARARGTSLTTKAMPGAASLASDVEDFTTRVVLLATSTDTAVATGAADIAPAKNPYKDLFGNTIKTTRLVSESTTSQGNANVRAQLQLNRFTGTRDAVTLNSTTHDVAGSLTVGEPVWVYDPDAGLYDNANELQWQGETIHPVLLRVTTLTWPVEDGRGAYVRRADGTWLDITNYVKWESGQTNVTVGGYDRALVTTDTESVPTRISTTPQPNTTIPAAPAWVTPFVQTSYQSPLSGQTRTQIQLDWTQPLNTDATTIIDGDYYEIRYRTTTALTRPATHTQMSVYAHNALGTHDAPIPIVTGAWAYVRASWDITDYLLAELTPGNTYEFQVRAIDNGTPPNASTWSASQLVVTLADQVAPETPAPPVVAANPLEVQIVHTLGSAAGGTYNLALDLSYLEVHGQYEPNFEPIPTTYDQGGTLLGRLRATDAELRGSIPAAGSFAIPSALATSGGAVRPISIKVVAVDLAGNRSRPSAAASPIALELISSMYVSELTASKISAGTISSSILNGGLFHTNATGVGADVGFDGLGFYAIDAAGNPYFTVDDGGAYFRGTIDSGVYGGKRIEINPDFPAIRFWLDTTEQRYVMQPFSSDQPDDPADAPGLKIYGRNQLGDIEGARMVLYEDGWLIQQTNPTGRKGGYITSDVNDLSIGFENSAATTQGWHLRMGSTDFWLESNFSPDRRGAYFTGNQTDTRWGMKTSAGIWGPHVHCDPAGPHIEFYPADSDGWATIHKATNSSSSALFRLFDSGGTGALLKSASSNLQVRNWPDTAYASIAASAFPVNSDLKDKTDIVDANIVNPLAMITGTKVKKYRRKHAVGGSIGVPVMEDDPNADVEPGRPRPKRPKKDAWVVPPSEPADGPEEIGLIAQEAPIEIRHTAGDDEGVELYRMATLMWAGIQQLTEQVKSLNAEVAALKNSKPKG
jgi:hypothetical protein